MVAFAEGAAAAVTSTTGTGWISQDPFTSLPLWGTFWIQLCLQTCTCFWLGSAKDACASILADVVEYDPAFEQFEFELWDLAFEALTTLLHEFGQRHHLEASLIEEISLEALH